MPIYNLTEYRKKYSKTSVTLRDYYIDISIDPITNSKYFKYKTSITGKTANNGNTKEVEFSVPLNYLRNFWRKLDMPLINHKVSSTLTWSKNCVLTDMKTTPAGADNNRPAVEAPAGATFSITDAKLSVQVVTLSTKDDNTLLEQSKTGSKRTIKWNKYR